MTTLTLKPGTSTGIQKALAKTGTLNGVPLQYDQIHFTKGTYTINSLMYLNSNTKLTCDSGVIWKLADNCINFGEQVPILGQKEESIKGLDISGIEYNGNYSKQLKTPDDHGIGFGNFIGLKNVSDSVFHQMYIHDTEGDGFRIENGTNLDFAYNRGSMGGHDFYHLFKCSNVQFYNNLVDMRANNAIRVRSSNNIYIYDNVINGTTLAYAPAIQLENIVASCTSSNIYIFNNLIKGTLGPAIWMTGQGIKDTNAAKNVLISNNLILNCGKMPAATKKSGVGGIVLDGWDNVRIEYNTIDGCFGYGIMIGEYIGTSSGTGYKAVIRRNIITNTKPALYKGNASGTGICNLLDSKFIIEADCNCVWNNAALARYMVNDDNAIDKDPCYAGSGNYHLKSIGGHYPNIIDDVSSPCVFEEYELGRYDNTKEASVYCPPPSNLTPDEIIGDSAAVIILCSSRNDAIALSKALNDSEYLETGQEAMFYLPKDK